MERNNGAEFSNGENWYSWTNLEILEKFLVKSYSKIGLFDDEKAIK